MKRFRAAAAGAVVGGLAGVPVAHADDQPQCVAMYWYSVCSYPDYAYKVCNFDLDGQCFPSPPPAGLIPGLPPPLGVVPAPSAAGNP